MVRKFVFATTLVALASCSQEVPSSPPAPAAAVAVSPPAPALAAVTPTMTTGVVFAASVQSTNCSGAPAAVATVHWDASTAKSTGVAIYVESPGNARKLWVEGGAVGAETTGPWVFPQTRFSLVDKASGAELSSQDIGQLACP